MNLNINDIFAGYICFEGITDEQEEFFQSALQHFSREKIFRQISNFKSECLSLYTTNRNIDHFEKEGRSAFAVGYVSGLSNFVSGKHEISKYLLENDLSVAETFSCFVESRFSAFVMDVDRKQVSFHCDFFGKRKLFFKVLGQTIYFSSECRTLAFLPDPTEQVDLQTIRDLFVVSFSMGERTLLKNIKALPQGSFARWDSKELTFSPLAQQMSDEKTYQELSPEEYYKEMKRALRVVVEETGIKIANITGGSDTRLIFSMLDKSWGFEFRFDPRAFRKDPKTYYDYQVVEMMTELFDLNVAYVCDYTKNSKPFDDYCVLTHNRYSQFDIYNSLLTGMMGGETLGGAADHIFETMINDETVAQNEKEIISILSSTVLSQTRPSMDDLRILKSSSSFKDKDYFFNLIHVYGPSFSFHYNATPSWFETSQLTARKITPFLFDSVLRMLNRPGISKTVSRYRLYANIYQTFAKDLWEVPFNSQIAIWTYGAGKGNDIKGRDQLKINCPITETKKIYFSPKSKVLRQLIASEEFARYNDLVLRKLFLIDAWLEGTTVDS